jgi:hypothetical protein
MKKILSIIIFICSLQLLAQDSIVEKKVSKYSILELEQLRDEAAEAGSHNLAKIYVKLIKSHTNYQVPKLSDLSLGAAAYYIVDAENPGSSPPGRYPTPGLGIEFNLNYYFSKKFNISGLIRFANIVNLMIESGSVYNVSEKNNDYYFSGGALLEYRFFNWIGIDVKTGIEKLTNYPKKASGIYGGGLRFYLNSFDKRRLQQSLRLGVYQSYNQTGVKFNPYPIQEVYYGSAIIYELGYRVQFR